MNQPYGYAFSKDVTNEVGLQICRTSNGYCLTANETTSDKSQHKSILIHMDSDDLQAVVTMLTNVMRGQNE
jgi:hypothetical protein